MANSQNLQIIGNKEVLNILNQNYILKGLPEKLKTDKGGRLSQKNTRNFVTRKTSKLNIAHRECISVREQ